MSAKKRRRTKRRRADSTGAGNRPVPTKVSDEERRRRKAEAQRQRERTRKRMRSMARLRLAGILVAVVGVGALGVAWIGRSVSAKSVSAASLDAGEAAGCGSIQSPEGSPSRQHLTAGESPSYKSAPGVAGAHDPSPLPGDPHVYTAPVPEARAVHNLEHAYVLIYYRADGKAALRPDVVRQLTSIAKADFKVIMAPYPSLPEGTSLAFAAWNKLWSCPQSVSPEQARTIASGFIDAYRGSSNAPEPAAP